VEPLDANVLLAVHANAKGAFVHAMQGGPHIAEQVRFTVQVTDRQFPFGRILDLIQSVGTLFDSDTLPVSQHLRQLSLFSFQDFFKFV
jgi:hypothetical protein